jgi:hypothetical protein
VLASTFAPPPTARDRSLRSFAWGGRGREAHSARKCKRWHKGSCKASREKSQNTKGSWPGSQKLWCSGSIIWFSPVRGERSQSRAFRARPRWVAFWGPRSNTAKFFSVQSAAPGRAS